MTPKSLLRHKMAVSENRKNSPPDPASTGFCGTTRNKAIPTPSWSPDATRSNASSCVRARSTTTCWKNATRVASTMSTCCGSNSFTPSRRNLAGQRAGTLQKRRNRLVSGRTQKPRRAGPLSNPISNGSWPHQSQTHPPGYAGRATSASPATGLASQHKAQQAALVMIRSADHRRKLTNDHRSPRPHPWANPLPRPPSPHGSKSPAIAVAVDEMLCELETDKVTVEVPAPVAGTMGEIVAAEGETVGVDALAGHHHRRRRRSPCPRSPRQSRTRSQTASGGDSHRRHGADLGRKRDRGHCQHMVQKKRATASQQDEMLCELETDKVSVEVPAPAAGIADRDSSPTEGDTVAAGGKLATSRPRATAFSSRPESAATPGKTRPPPLAAVRRA